MYGVMLFAREPWTAFVALGSVVLAVTGCEALYADMGHFGARAIRWAWLYFALPALLLNYFGQGALLLSHPADASFLFYAMVPRWAHYPMVALAAMATIIASQAVISGVFSITRQACSWDSCRGWKSATPRPPSRGRFLCRASMCCCAWAWS